MTADFIQIELFAIFIAVGISVCIWGIWKIVETLAEEYDKEQTAVKNGIPLEEIRNEIERATIEMDYDTAKEALNVIDKYTAERSNKE